MKKYEYFLPYFTNMIGLERFDGSRVNGTPGPSTARLKSGVNVVSRASNRHLLSFHVETEVIIGSFVLLRFYHTKCEELEITKDDIFVH